MKLIPITKGKYAQVDDEDYEEMNSYKWQCQVASRTFYAYRKHVVNGIKRNVKMHRQIMCLPHGDKRQIDHKDRNGLNNTLANLRVCDSNRNIMNASKTKRQCSSIYKGVHYDKHTVAKKKWRAEIRAYGKRVRIGRFQTEIEAGKAYDVHAKILHKDFAALNFPGK